MDKGTVVRTIVLIGAWVNQILAINHISPIPVDEITISSVITGIASLWTWWKNNNFTHAAKEGQKQIHSVKAGTNTNGGMPTGDDY